MSPQNKFVLGFLAGWIVIAVFAVFYPHCFDKAPDWLDSWSRLIATVTATIIGARVLLTVPKQLETFLEKFQTSQLRQEALLQQVQSMQQR